MKLFQAASASISAAASALRPSAERGGGAFLRSLPLLGGYLAKRAPGGQNKASAKTLEMMLLPQARGRWSMPYAAQMTPQRIEMILRSALSGENPQQEQELYSLMEATSPRLMKNLAEVKQAVLGLDWNLMDAPEELRIPGAKELIERTMNGMKGDPLTDGNGWRATLASLLDARPRGASLVEIEWEYRGGGKLPAAWLPKLTRDVDATCYGWVSETGRLRLYPTQSATQAEEVPPNKFLVGIYKSGRGHAAGTALLRSLAGRWCAANFSEEWLLNFAQIFGQPFRWATYDASQEGVKETLSEMLRDMGSAAYGVGPDGTKIEYFESGKSGADNPQAYVMKLYDEACDLLILGQTLTSSAGDAGSRALGQVHQSVRGDIIDGLADWLAEVLNEQLIPAIIAINYGDLGEDSGLPYYQPGRKDKKDTKVLAETFKTLLEAGIPLVKQEVYSALDMSEPAEGEAAFGTTAGMDAGQLPAEDPQSVRRMLAKLPVDAREYFMARMISEQTAEK